MIARNLYKIAAYMLALIVTALLAYGIGVGGARWVTDRRAEAKQADLTAAVLREMGGTVTVGKPLPDGVFDDLAGSPQKLRSAIPGKTLIVFLDAQCHYCLEEIRLVSRLSKERHAALPVLFISDAGGDALRAFQDQYELTVPIFRDPDGSYIRSLAITTFPFNVIVDHTLSVTDVIVGPISEKALRKVCIQ